MLHLLRTAVGATVLLGAYHVTFGLPVGEEAAGVEVVEASAGPGTRGGGDEREPDRRGSPSVPVEEVAVTTYSEVVKAIGTSRARRSIVVTAEAGGQVAEADLVANRLVAEGDVLLRLVSDLEEIEVSIAETELENARQTLQRYTTLNSASDGTVAGMTVQEAETAVALAEANLARARHALDALTIRAPISGRLGLTDLLPGGRIAAGAEIVTIDDTSRIVVSFELPERAIGLLEVGREVQATTPALAGQVLEATVTAFDSRIDETTRTVTVEAEIDNDEGRLWPGMSFSVSIPNDSEPLPQVPATALGWTAEGSQVWAVRNGLAAAVPVIVRMRQGEAAWVEGDLSDGDRVVVDGEARLREGTPVDMEEPATGAGGEPSHGRREGGAPQEAGADAAGRATGASGQTSPGGGAG